MKEEVRQAIMALSDLNGGHLTAQQLFDSVKADPNHPARDQFEWNQRQGWLKYNLGVARILIRSVKVEIQTTELIAKRVPVFAPEPAVKGGYATLDKLAEDEALAREVAVRELREAARLLRRATQISIRLGFSPKTIAHAIKELTDIVALCTNNGGGGGSTASH